MSYSKRGKIDREQGTNKPSHNRSRRGNQNYTSIIAEFNNHPRISESALRARGEACKRHNRERARPSWTRPLPASIHPQPLLSHPSNPSPRLLRKGHWARQMTKRQRTPWKSATYAAGGVDHGTTWELGGRKAWKGRILLLHSLHMSSDSAAQLDGLKSSGS